MKLKQKLEIIMGWWIGLGHFALNALTLLASIFATIAFYLLHRYVFQLIFAATNSRFLSDAILVLMGISASFAILRLLTNYDRSKKELKLAYQKLKEVALRDSLTGLYNNRDFLLDEIQRLRALAIRNNEALVFFFMDMDKFKKINDEISYSAGDDALKAVSGVVGSILREEVILFRYGGDEFFTAIRFENNDQLEENVAHLARRIAQAVSNSHCYSSGTRVPISISIGTRIVDLNASLKAELDVASDQMKQQKSNRE